MKRSKVREHVFRLIFMAEFNEAEEMPEIVNRFYQNDMAEYSNEEDDTENGMVSEKDQGEVKERFDAVLAKKSEIDKLLQEKITGWSLDRIGKVELSVLRLAVFEIKYDEKVPESVAIDEAVELAKKYGQDGAGAFVNGILAKFTTKE